MEEKKLHIAAIVANFILERLRGRGKLVVDLNGTRSGSLGDGQLHTGVCV